MTTDTTHKAPLIVHTAAGTFVPANSQVVTFDPVGIAAVEGAVDVPGEGTCWAIAGLAAGTTTLTVSGVGSTGTLTVTVTAAPLALTLGPAIPR